MESAIQTARKTLHLLNPSKETHGVSSKTTTMGLPAAIFYAIKQAITYFDRRFIFTSGILVLMSQMPFFLLSILNLSNKAEDVAYGVGYSAVAIGTLLLKSTFNFRQIMVTSLVCLWGLRLSLFLLYRAYHMEDFRMKPVRRTTAGLITFWAFQILEVWLNSLPVTLLNSFGHNPRIGLSDAIGYSLWIVGFGIETISDIQKFQYKQYHKDRWVDVGFYKYSRHPNYFGEILLWFGIFFMVAPTLQGWTYISVLAPIFHAFVVMFVSGIPPLERKYNEQWGNNPEYLRYKECVPILVPAKPHTHARRVMKNAEKRVEEKIR